LPTPGSPTRATIWPWPLPACSKHMSKTKARFALL
jgi:hypothetical protein